MKRIKEKVDRLPKDEEDSKKDFCESCGNLASLDQITRLCVECQFDENNPDDLDMADRSY